MSNLSSHHVDHNSSISKAIKGSKRSSSIDSSSTPLLLSQQQQQQQQALSSSLGDSDKTDSPSNQRGSNNNNNTPSPGLLHPRLAVVLNVPRPWLLWLFALRLFSIVPALCYGLPSIIRHLLPVLEAALAWYDGQNPKEDKVTPHVCPPIEASLAIIWCLASGYLSFFFTDCLMSRWLINYAHQATIVRLVTLNLLNMYITHTALFLAGGFQDNRLLLPGWIGIATTLTVLYHLAHKKINIRKETSTSVNVFSIASFISMIALLAHVHQIKQDYPVTPIVSISEALAENFYDVALRIKTDIPKPSP